MGKGKPRYIPPAGARKAFAGLLTMVSNVLTDSQLSHEQCGTTIRSAMDPAEGTARALHDHRLRVSLDASTGHVTQADWEKREIWPIRTAVHEYGCVVFLPEDIENLDDPAGWQDQDCDWGEVPSLRAVIEYAMSLDCSFVNFDQDGGQHRELPTYDW